MRWRASALVRIPAVRAALVALPLLLTACHTAGQRAGAYEAVYNQQMASKNYRGALQAILKAVAADENQTRLWLELARVQGLLNQPTANSSYQHALDLDPSNIEALEALSVLSVRSGQYDNAKLYIEPLLLLQPNDLNGLLASGVVALQEHRYGEADRIATTLITNAPDDAEGYVLRAREFDLTGHPQQAAAVLEQRVRLDPTNLELLQELITLYRKSGDRNGVRATALRLMPLIPDDPRYPLEVARVYHATGRDGEARKVIAGLTARFGRDVSVMLAVARLWSDIAPREEAHEQTAAIAAKAPPRIRAALADQLTGTGDPARAIALLAPLARQAVTVDNLEGQAAYARALYIAGQKDAAAGKADAILALDGTNPTALMVRARLALARGDYLQAATDAQVVANDDEANEEAAVLVAQVYAAQGNQLLAGNAFAQLRTKFADSVDALRAEGQWLLAQKRSGDAVQHASRFVETHREQPAGWQAYREICTAAHDAACLDAARRGLARFS